MSSPTSRPNGRGLSCGVSALLWIGVVITFIAEPAVAQVPVGTLSTSTLAGDTGDVLGAEVLLESSGDPLSGWSYGLCQDPDVATLLTVDPGITTLTAKNGNPADFSEFVLYPGGYTHAAVICFGGCPGLGIGSGYSLSTSSYQLVGLAPATTPLSLCGTLGTPLVPVVVASGSVTEPASTANGSISVLGPDPVFYDVRLNDAVIPYNVDLGIATFTAVVTVTEIPGNTLPPNGISAANLTLQYPQNLLTPAVITPGPALQALDGGSGPAFFDVTLNPGSVEIAMVSSIGNVELVDATLPIEFVTIAFDANPTTLMNSLFGIAAAITWGPVSIDSNAQPVGLTLDSGSVFFTPSTGYRHADSTDDGAIGLSDVLTTLNFLFLGGTLACPAAADFNANGSLGLEDIIGTLNFLFTGGVPPAAPFPACGVDVGTSLECDEYLSCM